MGWLGGPGQWVLALPAHRVAGFQVLVRSVMAGTTPVPLGTDGFTVPGFAAATGLLTANRRYTSLVPTQLRRLLADPAGRTALRAFDAVLVGGAALADQVRAEAERAGVAVVTTYGMTETCGGCVYDGRPLDGVRLRVDPQTGVISVGGPVVALGYVSGATADDHAAFWVDTDGTRWFTTRDHGMLSPNGRLTVLGRTDQVINTGGVKVAPRAVEEALESLPQVAECAVVGVPDAEWGERVTAVLVPRPGTVVRPGAEEVRDLLRGALEPAALPRQVLWVSALPLLPSGKVDPVALRTLLTGGDDRLEGPAPDRPRPKE